MDAGVGRMGRCGGDGGDAGGDDGGDGGDAGGVRAGAAERVNAVVVSRGDVRLTLPFR